MQIVDSGDMTVEDAIAKNVAMYGLQKLLP